MIVQLENYRMNWKKTEHALSRTNIINTFFWIFIFLNPRVERVEVKDVRLPQQLQRAMAAEAEATREARAKVCNNNNVYLTKNSKFFSYSILFEK